MSIQAVLFDFDGTLLNTNDLIFASYSYGFQSVLGRDITTEERVRLYGRPLYESLAEFGDKRDAIYTAYKAYQAQNHDRLVKTFPGVAEGVRRLCCAGFKMAVVTSKRYETLLQGLKILGLENEMDTCITPEDTVYHKPHPQPVLTACKRLGTDPRQAIMVGDSVFDFECGKAAGTFLAGVNYSTTREALLRYQPLIMVDSIDELSRFLIDRREKNKKP